jgi:hypothetical protein
MVGIHEFAIVGEYETEVVFGNCGSERRSVQSDIGRKLDKAIWAFSSAAPGEWVQLLSSALFANKVSEAEFVDRPTAQKMFSGVNVLVIVDLRECEERMRHNISGNDEAVG